MSPLQPVDLDHDAVVELEQAQAPEPDLGENTRGGAILDAAAADQLVDSTAVERIVTDGECRLRGDTLTPACRLDEVPDLDVVVARSLPRADRRELGEADPLTRLASTIARLPKPWRSHSARECSCCSSARTRSSGSGRM